MKAKAKPKTTDANTAEPKNESDAKAAVRPSSTPELQFGPTRSAPGSRLKKG